MSYVIKHEGPKNKVLSANEIFTKTPQVFFASYPNLTIYQSFAL